MEEDYDVIILGTGLKECIISGLLSADEKKVLHIDKNNFYGAETSSACLKEFYACWPEKPKNEELIKLNREFIIDRCPKFIMACGNLVKMLLHTRVTRYMDFQVVDASYVYKDGKLFKMPATPAEAMTSNLVGFFQKKYLRSFLRFVNDFKKEEIETHSKLKKTMRKTMESFGLDENSMTSIGHALALQLHDDYLDDPDACIPVIDAIKLYSYSMGQYGESAFIYPQYSLSNLPESFARMSAVHGGIYMLNKPVEKILYDSETGRVTGIRSQGETARCKMLLADPSYFPANASKKTGSVARWICITRQPLPQAKGVHSCQVVIPGSRVKRKNDIYVAMVSYTHKVVPENVYLVSVSTVVETENPKKEVEIAKNLIGNISEEFFFVTDYLTPTEEFKKKDDGTFMSESYDATTHFETVTQEVLRIYGQMSGKKFDLSIKADADAVANS